MATVEQVAKASLQRIVVQASEASLDPSEYADFIFALNNYMADLESQGIRLGYQAVSNIGETVTVPPGALRGIIANMAVEMAPDYDRPIVPALQRAASEGYKAMCRLGKRRLSTALPSTLSRGSGNNQYTWYTDNFYDGAPYENGGKLKISAETATTISTINTYVDLAGTWSTEDMVNFDEPTNGELRHTSVTPIDYFVTGLLSVEGTLSDNLTLKVVRWNNIASAWEDSFSQPLTVVSGTRNTADFTISLSVQLAQYDKLKVQIANNSGTDNVTAVTGAYIKAVQY